MNKVHVCIERLHKMFSLPPDFDECLAESVCPIGSQCKNSFGSYLCECEPGLAMDGDTCKGM